MAVQPLDALIDHPEIGLTAEQKTRAKMKRTMVSEGFYEASTLAFYADADLDALHIAADAPERKVIRLLNPITFNLTIMRPLLIPSLLNVVVENIKRGNNAGRLFELANTYVPKQLPVTELPEERLHLGFAAFGEEEDFFVMKGSVEAIGEAFGIALTVSRCVDKPFLHPGIAAYIEADGEAIGYFGKLANDVAAELKLPKDNKAGQTIYVGEIDYATLMAHAPAVFRYQPIPTAQPISRDLALVAAEEITCGQIEAEIRKACPAVCDVRLFDIYRSEHIGEGKKSMAFAIAFNVEAGDQIDRFISKILGNLKFKLGIEIR